MGKLALLVISPECDGTDVGETWTAFEWISRLSKVCDVTLLTLKRPGRVPPSQQLPDVTVVEWEYMPKLNAFPKFVSGVRPYYPMFCWHVRKWIRAATRNGHKFDLIHHLTPLALRYPSPAVGLGIPYIIGPLAGSLTTPKGFEKETRSAPLYIQLRRLDGIRFRWDKWLRATYAQAEIVLCSSPYVEEIILPMKPKRTMIVCEVGIETIATPKPRSPGQEIRLLHVGRAVRTKGLRDAVRAMSYLKDLPNVRLDAVGGGEETSACQEEAERLGVADKIRFHGRLDRPAIEELYEQSDIFVFPSFREPTGIVLFEAMRHGLPVITTTVGGPGYIVNDSCGIQINPVEPDQFAYDISVAIRKLTQDPDRRTQLGSGAVKRIEEIGFWPNKIQQMLSIYHSAISKPTLPKPVEDRIDQA